jgi:integrase
MPSYRLHKQSGQAIVTLTDIAGNRRDVLLGKHGTPESEAEYLRVVGEWKARGRRLPDREAGTGIRVNEVLEAFLLHAEQHYRRADGTVTAEVVNFKLAIRHVREAYGLQPAASFGPLALKAVRQKMIEAGLCRNVVNHRCRRIVRAFKWAASEELVPVAVWQALLTVRGLQQGRTKARETAPIGPVADVVIDATLPLVLPPVAALIRLQRATGMRSGEAVLMRACDLDTSGKVWLYTPSHHKLAHKGRPRVVALGPQAQAIIRPFLTLNVQDFLFSPRRALEERRLALRVKRRTRVQPSQQNRRLADPAKGPGERYFPGSYAQAIRKACEKAELPHWHPHQLRHTFATEARRQFGLEATRTALGHAQTQVTEVYAERDTALAAKVAAAIG